jgi:hypothetical protein
MTSIGWTNVGTTFGTSFFFLMQNSTKKVHDKWRFCSRCTYQMITSIKSTLSQLNHLFVYPPPFADTKMKLCIISFVTRIFNQISAFIAINGITLLHALSVITRTFCVNSRKFLVENTRKFSLTREISIFTSEYELNRLS